MFRADDDGGWIDLRGKDVEAAIEVGTRGVTFRSTTKSGVAYLHAGTDPADASHLFLGTDAATIELAANKIGGDNGTLTVYTPRGSARLDVLDRGPNDVHAEVSVAETLGPNAKLGADSYSSGDSVAGLAVSSGDLHSAEANVSVQNDHARLRLATPDQHTFLTAEVAAGMEPVLGAERVNDWSWWAKNEMAKPTK